LIVKIGPLPDALKPGIHCVTVRISYRMRAWFDGPWRLGTGRVEVAWF
jgi:hypothetical protein